MDTRSEPVEPSAGAWREHIIESIGVSSAAPGSSFAEASRLVVDHLKAAVPLGYWAVTRYDGRRQLYLEVRDDAYGTGPGDSHPWPDSFCVRMVAGEAPSIAPDAMAIEPYAKSGVAQELPIGTYVGIPLTRGDGTLFGTVCGLDPQRSADELHEAEPLLRLLSRLLEMILDADSARVEVARALERAELIAELDELTGVLNRRGWERACAAEEPRLRRFGEPAAVLVADLDDLKQVNDEEGHAAGDRYLVRAARVLRSVVRDHDHVARIGGDEFVVLSIGLDPAGADRLVGRIREAMADAGVSASIGVAIHRIQHGLADTTAEADAAMYDDKAVRRGDPARR